MKPIDLIGRHLNFVGVLMLTAFVGAAAGLFWGVAGRIQIAARAGEFQAAAGQHACPMHPEIVNVRPGRYPKCGDALTLASEAQSTHAGHGAVGETGLQGCCAKPQRAGLNLLQRHPPVHNQNAQAGCSIASADATAAGKSSR